MFARRQNQRIAHADEITRTKYSVDVESNVRRGITNHVAGNQQLQRLLKDSVVQAKLTVNEPGDKYEREADQVVESVMRQTDGDANPIPITGTTRSAAGGEDLTVGKTTEKLVELLRGGGKSLQPDARSFFEARFGRDFSDVTIHTGPWANEAARSIGAEAFTHGSDIAFAMGNYRPGTEAGDRLLAHELAHVVQERESAAPTSIQRASTAGATATATVDSIPYEIQFGDTLWDIAREYDVEGGWRALWNYKNNRAVVGENPDLIHPGDVIKIPMGGGPTKTTKKTNQPSTIGGSLGYKPDEVENSKRTGIELATLKVSNDRRLLRLITGTDLSNLHKFRSFLVYGFPVGESDLEEYAPSGLLDPVLTWEVVRQIPVGGQYYTRKFHVLGCSDAVGSDERNEELRQARARAVAKRIYSQRDEVTGVEFGGGFFGGLPLAEHVTPNDTPQDRRKNRSAIVYDVVLVKTGRESEPKEEVDPDVIDLTIDTYKWIENNPDKDKRTAQLAELYRQVLEHWQAKQDFRYWSDIDMKFLFLLWRGLATYGDSEKNEWGWAIDPDELEEEGGGVDEKTTHRLLAHIVEETELTTDGLLDLVNSDDKEKWKRFWEYAFEAFQTDGYPELTRGLQGADTPREVQIEIQNWINRPFDGVRKADEGKEPNVYQYVVLVFNEKVGARKEDQSSIYYVLDTYRPAGFSRDELYEDPNREIKPPLAD